jgi:hypothetical protein
LRVDTKNRQIVLAAPPEGLPQQSDFRPIEAPRAFIGPVRGEDVREPLVPLVEEGATK